MPFTADTENYPPYFPDITEVLGAPPGRLLKPTIKDSTGTDWTSYLTFSYSSTNESVATISGDVVTFVGVGTTTITCTQTQNFEIGYYSTDITMELTVTGDGDAADNPQITEMIWQPMNFLGYNVVVYPFDNSIVAFVPIPGVQFSEMIVQRVGGITITMIM